MSVLRRLTLLLLLVLLAACQEGPVLPPLPPGGVVLAFGDSLTFGTGAAAGESYPDRLQVLIGREVVNAGIPGELSAEGRRRLPELLDRHRPALLVLCHGGNDLLQRSGEGPAAENLRAMLSAARERRVGVLLVGVPRPGLFLSPPPLYEELAGEFAVPYEGEALPEILADRTLKSDPIHPNAEGYRRLAEALARRLKKAGAL